ncbi:putative quinone binding protein [hydrothermal vent metagenome]|uniref:Putative quinone binding protein n=1 Tax=hydrothermal vent metagenome TaxID=652676 RepID=A0A3B1CIV5_9ZZZZ
MSLDAIGIVSGDLRKSISFYETLGVSLAQVGGPDHYEGTTRSGVRLMLDSVDLIKKINPGWQAPDGGGVILCFKQESPEKVDELFQKIIDAGFEIVKEPWDAFWGQRYASVKDPDGNQIDLFAPL